MSLNLVMALSVGFSAVGVLIIRLLDDTSHVLIPDWEDDVSELSPDPSKEPQLKPAAGAAGCRGRCRTGRMGRDVSR